MKRGFHLSGIWQAWFMALPCAMALSVATPAHAAPTSRLSAATILGLPHSSARVDFDDLHYLPALQRVSVPAAQTGNLYLIDPRNPSAAGVTAITDVAGKTGASPDEDPGATSADFGAGYLFIGDHTHTAITIVDPATRQIVNRAPLAADYDFVRFVSASQELWVTEPDQHRIETLKFAAAPSPHLVHTGFIAVPDGPEALAIDDAHGVAYTDSRADHTFAISLHTPHLVRSWRNSCTKSRGLALDGHFVVVACKEGKVVSLDSARNGHLVDAASSGPGVDLLAFNARLHHLYVPSSSSGTLAVFRVSAKGLLHRTGTYRTARGAHCVTTDNRGNVYVCDAAKGALLVFHDPG